MDRTTHPTHPAEAVVLWRRGGMTCTCRTHSPDRIEIRLLVVGVVVLSILLEPTPRPPDRRDAGRRRAVRHTDATMRSQQRRLHVEPRASYPP